MQTKHIHFNIIAFLCTDRLSSGDLNENQTFTDKQILCSELELKAAMAWQARVPPVKAHRLWQAAPVGLLVTESRVR